MLKNRNQFVILAVLLSTTSGCGTMSNVMGQEPWLIGPPPVRPTVPFGGIDNDVRWMRRGIGPEGCESLPMVAAAIDMPLSLVGDVVTLPWTTYQSLRPRRPGIKLYFDNEAMRDEILKYVSIGMPIETAKRIMEDNGFRFADNRFTGLNNHYFSHGHVIYGIHRLFVSDEIHVFLEDDGGKLASIEVDCRTAGQ
jgi:hypothetical protein